MLRIKTANTLEQDLFIDLTIFMNQQDRFNVNCLLVNENQSLHRMSHSIVL